MTKTQNPRRPDRLQRHAGVRRRKHYVVNGHKFEAQRSYQFMKCALCSDHLIAGVGYRCESCGYFCHRKCHEKVVTKCISRADDVEEVLSMSPVLDPYHPPTFYHLYYYS